MKSKNDLTCIGEIINTFGIKGELKVRPFTDNIKRYSKLDYILLGQNKDSYEISSVRYDKGFVFLKLKGHDDINDVLKFKNSYLYIYDKDREKLPQGTFYVWDLIGKEVYNSNNEFLGILEKIDSYPANDVFVIKNENFHYYIPNVKEFVKDIGDVIIADPIEGMREWKFLY